MVMKSPLCILALSLTSHLDLCKIWGLTLPCHIHTYLRQEDLSRLGPGSFQGTNTPHYNRLGIRLGKPVGFCLSFSH